jgi:transcription elongation factor GreA
MAIVFRAPPDPKLACGRRRADAVESASAADGTAAAGPVPFRLDTPHGSCESRSVESLRAFGFVGIRRFCMTEQLTTQQHAKLTAELAELEGPRRAEVIQAIATARGYGDLSENFEYHAAKNEQGLLERRIAILRGRLEDAVIVESAESDTVAVGHHVVVTDAAGERLDVEISSLGGAGTVSPSSPLGAALLGRRVGETVDVEAPRGAWQATIVEIRAA